MSEPKVQVVLEADVKQFAAGMQSAMTSLERLVKAGLVVKMVKDAVDFGKAIDQMVAKSGTTTEWIQKFGYAATQTGGSVEKLSAALFSLRRSMSDAVGGSAADLRAFESLGLSMQDLRDGNTAEIFERIAKAVRESGAGVDKVNAAAKVLGEGSAEVIAGMAKGYEELTREAERLGVVVDNQTIQSINRLDKGLGMLGAKIKSVTAEFVGHIASLEKWSLTAQMASLIVMAPKRLIMSGFLGGGGLSGLMNAGGELYRIFAEANKLVDQYKVVADGDGSAPGSAGDGTVSGLPSGSARRGRREETDALKRIGGYISGAGPTANLVNIQNQALQELRQIRSKLAEMARRDTSVNLNL